MRKILAAIILVALMSAMMAIPVSAGSNNGESIGVIPKTNVPITIDGVKEDVYNNGLIVQVRQPNNDKNGAGGGVAYFLWDDEALYIFCEVNVGKFIYPPGYNVAWKGMAFTQALIDDGWTDPWTYDFT